MKANTTPKLVQNSLYSKISAIIELARQRATTAINLSMVYAYYEIGKHIVENEQRGKCKAEYGKQVLMELSEKLTENFGQGFSAVNLQNMRNFYLAYSQNSIYQTVSNKLPISQIKSDQSSILQTVSEESPKYETLSRKFNLSWSHYLILMKI